MKLLRCRTCVMPARPDTYWQDGECSACISHRNRRQVDWLARKAGLLALLDKHDGRCIVPSSGGKDSTWQALTLKELGADVTAVTAATCHLTPIGRANIDNLARHVRTIEVTPSKTVRAKLNRLSLEMVGDPSWPEHVSIHRTPFKVAADLCVPLVFYGECPTAHYGGPPGSDDTMQMTQRWASEFAGFLGLRASDFVGMEGLTERDMADYEAPDAGTLESVGVEAHFLGQYLEWDSHRNAAVAEANGMRQELPSPANWWKAENLDNAQVLWHDRLMYLKYGFGRGCQQISVDVRHGRVSREAALEWVEQHDHLFPETYAGVTQAEMLDRIGMKRERLAELLDRFTKKAIHAV